LKIKLEKNHTQFIKGIGILLIIFHNYFHVLQPKIGENEYSYSHEIFMKFVHYLYADFANVIQYLSTYFGHYGVQLFIFCSGYGLTVLYQKKEVNYKKYISKRLLKLYPVFTISIIILLVYRHGILGYPFTYRTIGSVVIRYTLIANLIPGKIFSLNGPFWFYSMIVQLYLLFPFLISLVKKNKASYLWYILIISYIIILTTNSFFTSIHLNLYFNFIGNLPVFILGILFAKNNYFRISIILWVVSLLLFIGGQLNHYLWHFSQITFIIVFLPILLGLYNFFKRSKLHNFLLYTGGLSMYLFAVHGYMRIPWVTLSDEAPKNYMNYIYFILFIIIVYTLSILTKKIEEFFIKKLKEKYNYIK